ncbi:MAG: FHA domain-containing protein [Bacteroidaceae bacterium]|nr:FHA domain-containing protein [Bacteroidaceae bacterium]
MKRVRCPKCQNRIPFDDSRYEEGQTLVFECPECRKQFGIRIGPRKQEEEEPAGPSCGSIIVVENVFHFRQELPLKMGDNVIGRYVPGTNINTPIETVDPSVDTTHCIITVSKNRQGSLQYVLRDAPSGTGTFVGNTILRDKDRLRIEDGTIITIGATTLILSTGEEK